jgi:uncharacterized glyoxalase superfamily protein PhnB
MLTTNDIDNTIKFYSNVLGFECLSFDKERGFLSMSNGDVNIMFNTPNAHIPFDKPQFTGSLYIYSDDVDSIWYKVKENAKVCYPVETFDYGMREFAIYDNNGYLIKFGQSAQSISS